MDTGMIDLVKAESEALLYGITLREWMQLQVHALGDLESPEDSEDADAKDEKWRAQVADVLIENDLAPKAKRYIECSRFAVRYECQGADHHQLFSPAYCDLRFCPRCAPRQYARLMEKYLGVVKGISKKPRRAFAFRELTLTTKNTGILSSEQILKFNRDVRKTLKILMKGVSGWGALLCDEVGFNNTNLHGHILFFGPYFTQERLAAVWQEVSGDLVVYIRKAHTDGPRALRHLLKYVSKPPATNPQLVGRLETAFHKRRRVHAMGLFYDYAGTDMDNVRSEWTDCPHCGAKLTRLPGTVPIEQALLEGRTFAGSRNTERRREWVN
jgi:hypothetical protein